VAISRTSTRMKPRAEKARVDHAPTSASTSAVANGTRPGWYRANFPFFVLQDNPTERQLLVAPGTMIGPVDEPEPVLSELCSIHHRAYDHDLVGVSPDYDVRVSPRLLEDDDGPMLDLLKRFDRKRSTSRAERSGRPDRERLASRFERFLTRSAA
jgi:hypothetical protein